MLGIGMKIDGWCIPDPFVKDSSVGQVQLVNVGKVDERACRAILALETLDKEIRAKACQVTIG